MGANVDVTNSGPSNIGPVQGDARSGRVAFGVAFAGIVVSSAVIRCLAAGGDLWLDEIWSLHFAQSVSSPWALLTRIHHDNNHVLNTLLLYLLGEQETWVIYRLPAIVAGIATVISSGLIARRWGRVEALTAVILTASSYLLIHYGSEARGYGLVVLFALLSFHFMQCYLDGRVWAAVLFWPAVILGFLSHLTFLHVYIAMVVWSCVRFIKTQPGWRSIAVKLVYCHAIPIVFMVLLYFVHVRHIVVAGGPVFSLLDVIARTAALSLGVPETGPMAMAAAVTALLIVVYGVTILARSRWDMAVLFGVVTVLSPTLLLFVFPPKYLYVRYFLIGLVFFLLLLSLLFAHLYRRGVAGKAVYCVLMLAVVAGNARYTVDLLRHGRGHYIEALSYMVKSTPGNTVTVGSDHDFRNRTLVDFYAPRIDGGERIVYYNTDTWPEEGPSWVIVHSWIVKIEPSGAITDRFGKVYALTRSYRYARLSGWHWFLYRKQP